MGGKGMTHRKDLKKRGERVHEMKKGKSDDLDVFTYTGWTNP